MGLFASSEAPLAAIDRTLRTLVEDQALAPMDRMTGLALARGAESRPALAAALGAFVSHLRARGFVCARLDQMSSDPLWRRLSQALAEPGEPVEATSTGLVGVPEDVRGRPLIVDRDCLYTHRSWIQERELAAALRARGALALASPPPSPSVTSGLSEEQRAALRTALTRRLCVISGGPGSGKTTVAGAIVAAFLAARPDAGDTVGLAAPTGKAAARLAASVNQALARHGTAPAPTAQTLHRLLGWNRERAAFRFDRKRPLPLRLLVVDEVSMVDLDLMHALTSALEDDCTLVLLGDRDQLASVQPGNVLADVCAGLEQGHGEKALSGCVAALERSYRFATGSGIGFLAAAIRRGEAETVLEILAGGTAGLRWLEKPPADVPLPPAFLAAFQEADPAAALRAFDRFRVLCAHRRGRFGSEAMNRRLIAQLRTRALVPEASFGAHFDHELFVVVGNHYGLGLFNGDQGVIRRVGDGLQAFVALAEAGCRRIAPHRLPETEPGFCLTVHRSQGSEFDHVVLILPEETSPLLTRELLYTAVTRGRSTVEVWGREAAIRTAVERPTERGSGLAERLWGGEASEPAATPRQGELF